SLGHLYSVSVGSLDRPGHVPRLCFCGSGHRHCAGRPAIRAYPSLLRLRCPRALLADSCRNGLAFWIHGSHASDDHGPSGNAYGSHMSDLSRRKLIVTGLAATAGVSGLATAARLAEKYGLVPPDHGGIFGLGETLTYASQRLLTR